MNLLHFHLILPGPDCSTGSACLPSTGAVCGGKQRHLHQWKHVSQSVSPLWSHSTRQILVPSRRSLLPLLLSLSTPSFMSQAHDVVFVCACVCRRLPLASFDKCAVVFFRLWPVTWRWPQVAVLVPWVLGIRLKWGQYIMTLVTGANTYVLLKASE